VGGILDEHSRGRTSTFVIAIRRVHDGHRSASAGWTQAVGQAESHRGDAPHALGDREDRAPDSGGPFGVELRRADSKPTRAWERLRAALGAGPHQLVNWSSSGKQALIFAVTTDRDAFLTTAREHAPSEGVASFTARVWDVDPRQGDTAPEEIELVEPHAAWPRAGYGDDLMARLAAGERREPGRRGAARTSSCWSPGSARACAPCGRSPRPS
jgi:hypothetical protein